MAVLQNMWLKGAKKRLGGTVIYTSMGQTLQRELAASVSNPRTLAQMRQRVKWSNLVAFYRTNAPWMKYAFETKKRTQSEYNKLMSLNVAASNIYLTKQEAAGGACVVAPYVVSQGTLPSIEYNVAPSAVGTNIYLRQEEDWDEMQSVAYVSESIVASNPALQYGDQISFIRLTQLVNGATGIPYVVLRKYEMVLSRTNNDKWSNYLPADLITANTQTNRGFLEVMNNGAAGGFTFVISRTVAGKTYVSTQSIVPMNMDAFIASYSSDEALERAVASYGSSEDAFLSSNAANYGDDTPVDTAVLYVTIDGKKFMASDYLGSYAQYSGKVVKIVCNQEPALPTTINAIYGDGQAYEMTNVSRVGSVITATLPSHTSEQGVLWSIEVEDREGKIIFITFEKNKPSLPELS